MLELNYYIAFECKGMDLLSIDHRVRMEIEGVPYMKISYCGKWCPKGISKELWAEIKKHEQYIDCPVVLIEECSHSYFPPPKYCGTDYRVLYRFLRK